ncbi:MAG: XRE family transcriptional regulator [Terracidiphilus sp.]
MARNFKELQAKIPPERRAQTEERVQKAIAEMALTELRRARQFTQAGLAATLGVDQGSISKMEQRTDMYISTLRSYIEAMGGDLRVTASFPEGDVSINQFHLV